MGQPYALMEVSSAISALLQHLFAKVWVDMVATMGTRGYYSDNRVVFESMLAVVSHLHTHPRILLTCHSIPAGSWRPWYRPHVLTLEYKLLPNYPLVVDSQGIDLPYLPSDDVTDGTNTKHNYRRISSVIWNTYHLLSGSRGIDLTKKLRYLPKPYTIHL